MSGLKGRKIVAFLAIVATCPTKIKTSPFIKKVPHP